MAGVRGQLAACAVTVFTLGALAFPSASTAATAQVLNNTLSYEASSGEANRLKITYEDLGSFRSRYTFEDLGAAVTPGLGCDAISARRVSCEGDFIEIAVEVGDLADSVTMPRVYRPSGPTVPCPVCVPERFDATVVGGDGDDVLTGGHATGGGARLSPLESLRGGDGDDRLTAGGHSGEGGPGPYTHLSGGEGNDEMECVDRRNSSCVMEAGPGGDSLAGGSSDDGAGTATDRFMAGPGDDTVRSADNVEEEVDCGEGVDRFESDPIDRVTNCETPFTASPTAPASVPNLLRPSAHGSRRRGLIVSVVSGRLSGSGETQCGGRVRIAIRARGKLLARRRAAMRADCLYSRRVALPVGRLPRHQRRRLPQGKSVVLAATVRYRGSGGLPADRSPTRRYRVEP